MSNQKPRSAKKPTDWHASLAPLCKSTFTLPPTANTYTQDGVDHINLGSRPETDIGRFLSFTNMTTFRNPILGTFRGLDSLFYFVSCEIQNDEVRQLAGPPLRNFVRNNCGRVRINTISNLRAAVMFMAYLRLIENRSLSIKVLESTLPFDCYRTTESGLRDRDERARWICMGYEEIRSALKEKREPAFDSIMDNPDASVFAGLQTVFSKMPNFIIPDITGYVSERRATIDVSMKKKKGGKKSVNGEAVAQDSSAGVLLEPMVSTATAGVVKEVPEGVVVEDLVNSIVGNVPAETGEPEFKTINPEAVAYMQTIDFSAISPDITGGVITQVSDEAPSGQSDINQEMTN